jgi:hypothetical protein
MGMTYHWRRGSLGRRRIPVVRPSEFDSRLLRLNPVAPGLRLVWKVIARIEPTWRGTDTSGLFHQSPNTGLYRQFGFSEPTFVPLFLRPTVIFHQAIGKLLRRRAEIDLPLRRFPYRLPMGRFGDGDVSMKIRLFAPNVVTVTFTVDALSPPNGLWVDGLIQVQDIRRLSPLREILEWTIGIVEAASQKRFRIPGQFLAKPALHLTDLAPIPRFEKYLGQHRHELAALVVRAPDPPHMDGRIEEAIWQKNADVNTKSIYQQFLIDKQGMVAVTASPTRTEHHLAFDRLTDMYELALVSGAVIDAWADPDVAIEEEASAAALAAIDGWVTEPERAFHKSTSNQHVWTLLVDEFKLKARLRAAARHHRTIEAGFRAKLVRLLSSRGGRWLEVVTLGVVTGVVVWVLTR